MLFWMTCQVLLIPLTYPFSSCCVGVLSQYNDGFYERSNIVVPPSIPKIDAMKFVCADVTKGLPFDDNCFDIIICKGCMDAILQNPGHDIRRMMAECHRLLLEGTLIIITHGNPESRMVYFENEHDEWWDKIAIHTIPKSRDRRNDMGPMYVSHHHYCVLLRNLANTHATQVPLCLHLQETREWAIKGCCKHFRCVVDI